MDASTTFMLLMEDSGDSELAALHIGSNSRPSNHSHDDDAESSSCDSLYESRLSELEGIGHYEDEKKPRNEEEEEDDDGVGGYEESWSSVVGLMVKHKSCASEESKANELPMNEVERNRLFWEACLAS